MSIDPRLHGPEFCPRVCTLCACEDGRSRHCWAEDGFDPSDPEGDEADERQKAVFAWDVEHGTDHAEAFYGCRHCRAWAEAEYVWELEGEGCPMPTLRVDVTEEDIREGTPNDARRCALARAFERATGFACLVDGKWLRLGRGMASLALPEEAQDFQARFDGPGGRWQVLPFAFEVDVPEVSARA